MTSQPHTGQSTSYGDMKSTYKGASRWDRSGFAKEAPRSANRPGEEQYRHTRRGSHTRRDEGEHGRQGRGAQQGRRGNQEREPEWRGWESMRMGGGDNKGDGLASQPRRHRVPGQPLLNRHQVGGVSCSPSGLFAQQEWEPIRGRPAVRGKGTYGGQSGQRVEQGTWASRTRKHSETAYGRPVDRGAWMAKTVEQPQRQPAKPQYANYWAHRRANGTPCHIQHSPSTPTTGLRKRGNNASKSTGRNGQQKAATRRNMRREERVTVHGPVKKQQPDGMSHRGQRTSGRGHVARGGSNECQQPNAARNLVIVRRDVAWQFHGAETQCRAGGGGLSPWHPHPCLVHL